MAINFNNYMQERGRKYKDQLDRTSNEYAGLHTAFKKFLKVEKEAEQTRLELAGLWEKASNLEAEKPLATAFKNLAQTIRESEEVHSESETRLREVVQEAFRVFPLHIRQQKRSLSRRTKSPVESEVPEPDLESSISGFQNKHQNDMRFSILHLVNSLMYYHSNSLQKLSEVFQEVQNIESN